MAVARLLEGRDEGRRRAHRHEGERCASRSGISRSSTRTRNALVTHAVVEAHETALVFVDGAFVEQLTAGRHAFWNVDRTVKVQKLDLRPQALEITAQEILTKDRVSVRVTLTAFWRIVDPMKAVGGATDVAQTLYKVTQFAIREAVAARTLDDILGGARSARRRVADVRR